MEEVWKDIEGYEGLYKVSSSGRVRSLDRVSKNHPLNGDRKLRSKILSGRPSKQGYLSVVLYNNDGGTNLPIHRLVAQAFISNPKNLPVVRHYPDPTITNNRKNNLMWGTYKDNSLDTIEMDRQTKGEEVHLHVLKECEVIDIWKRLCSSTDTCNKIANNYGVNRSTIIAIAKKKTWIHVTCNLTGTPIKRAGKSKIICPTKRLLAIALMVDFNRSTRFTANKLGVSKSFTHKLKKDYG